MNGLEMLQAIADHVSEVTKERVVLGVLPVAIFQRYRGTLTASNEVARDLLEETLKATTATLRWQLLYAPDAKFYALNIAVVKVGKSGSTDEPAGGQVPAPLGPPPRGVTGPASRGN
jgi:hypothetical protein